MVTPLARRRPVKVARETATLDQLSGGRLTLGVGLGSDRFVSEFSITGEELDERSAQRSRRIARGPGGRLVWRARGPPRRALRGGRHAVPAAAGPATGRTDMGRGLLRQAQAIAPGGPVPGLLPPRPGTPDQLAEIVADLTALRRQAGTDPAEPYDVVVSLPPGATRALRRQAHMVAGRVPRDAPRSTRCARSSATARRPRARARSGDSRRGRMDRDPRGPRRAAPPAGIRDAVDGGGGAGVARRSPRTRAVRGVEAPGACGSATCSDMKLTTKTSAPSIARAIAVACQPSRSRIVAARPAAARATPLRRLLDMARSVVAPDEPTMSRAAGVGSRDAG